MKWLLVVFVFNVGADRQPHSPVIFYKSYISEAECNHVGQNFREVFDVPADRRSMSVCIPEDAYEARDWMVID